MVVRADAARALELLAPPRDVVEVERAQAVLRDGLVEVARLVEREQLVDPFGAALWATIKKNKYGFCSKTEK